MSARSSTDPAAAMEACRALGKRNVVLSIHDASFPSLAFEDTGRGTPYSEGALALIDLVKGLGFNGIQLGPQGRTSAGNASPYDSTLFSKNPMSIALARLAPEYGELVDRGTLEQIVDDVKDRGFVDHRRAHALAERALGEVYARFTQRRARGELGELAAELDGFRREEASWLEPDSLYEARYAPELERYALEQLLVHRQHERFRREMSARGMKLFGDLQIGLSSADARHFRPLFLESYRLGAPPSRTNPDGQPWGYSILDPLQYRSADGTEGPALAFVRARLDKMFREYDALRIDHPHGWVCPWVYSSEDPDPVRAVQRGARLFDSPDLPDHPALARFAVARRAQINPNHSTPRYADDWIVDLDDEQVERYAALVAVVIDAASAHGRSVRDLSFEVLSTLPYPLARVLERYGLGRFRVTQKARIGDATDVYLSENARPEDWIMPGNHDTPPVWRLARERQGGDSAKAEAAYLARRLRPQGDRLALEREILAHPSAWVEARFADVFASRAENVLVFFADLFGQEETYNAPGTIDERNWSLRAPPEIHASYGERTRERRAVDMGRVLAMALEARGLGPADLVRRLREP